MLKDILTHWKSSLFGVLGGSLGALAVTAGVDTMQPKQLALAYLACVGIALKGLFSADADKVAPK